MGYSCEVGEFPIVVLNRMFANVVLDADRSTGETNLMRTTIGRKSHDLSQHTGTLNYCRISYRSVA